MAAVYGRPTLHPAQIFNPERAAMKLQRAMKGIGTDERVLIEVLTGYANFQRQEIKKKYKTMYGRELAEDLKAELGGNFEDVCLALLASPHEYMADCLYDAMKGAGTDEWCIIDVICTNKNADIEAIRQAYQEKYKSELEDDLKDEIDGDFRSLIRSLINANRDESIEENLDEAVSDAKGLFEAGVGQIGTDEGFFNMILSSKSIGHLRQVFTAYSEVAGHDITDALNNEFSGDALNGMTALVKALRDIHGYYAERLHTTMKGPGTEDSTLIRIIVSRSELDLQDIKEKYRMMYGKDLGDAVSDDTSGDYRKILMKIIN